MKYEGTNRACDRNNQGICDAAQYSILRSEWQKPRHYAEGIVFSDDAELVREVYQRYDENSRLNKSNAARVEFLTTVRYIEKYLAPGAKILDVGAGAGEYSLYFLGRCIICMRKRTSCSASRKQSVYANRTERSSLPSSQMIW